MDYEYLASRWQCLVAFAVKVKDIKFDIGVTHINPISDKQTAVKYASLAAQVLINLADTSSEFREIKLLICLLILIHRPIIQILNATIKDLVHENLEEMQSILMTLIMTKPIIPVTLSAHVLSLISTVRTAVLLLHFVVYCKSSTQYQVSKLVLLLVTDFFSIFTISIHGADRTSTWGVLCKLLESACVAGCCVLVKTQCNNMNKILPQSRHSKTSLRSYSLTPRTQNLIQVIKNPELLELSESSDESSRKSFSSDSESLDESVNNGGQSSHNVLAQMQAINENDDFLLSKKNMEMTFQNIKEVHEKFPAIIYQKSEQSSVLCKIKVSKLNLPGMPSQQKRKGSIDFQTNLDLIRFTNSFFKNLPKSLQMVSELKK